MTYILKIKEENESAIAILEIIKKLPFFELKKEEPSFNSEFLKKIEKSVEEAENGDVVELKDMKAFWESLK